MDIKFDSSLLAHIYIISHPFIDFEYSFVTYKGNKDFFKYKIVI